MCDSGVQSTILGEARNIDMFIQEMSVKDLFSVDVDTYELHVRPIRSLRNLYQQKHCQPGLKGSEMGCNEGRMANQIGQVQRPAGLPGLL